MLKKPIVVNKHKYHGVFKNFITDYYISRYKSIIIYKTYPKIIERCETQFLPYFLFSTLWKIEENKVVSKNTL